MNVGLLDFALTACEFTQSREPFLGDYCTGYLHKAVPAFPGLVNFVPAVDDLFCLNLPAAFSQPGNGLREIPCT